jgi:hypothetical protein
MRLLGQSCVFAYCGVMLVTNPDTPHFRGDIPDPTQEDSRRGFLARDRECIYLYIRNHTWRVPVSVYLADSAPGDFGEAERVVRFPFVATTGELLVGGIDTGPKDWRRVEVSPGDYTLYWVGYNLHKRWPSEEQMDMEDQDYAEVRDVERYDIVFMAWPCTNIEVLKGNAYLYDKAPV